MRKKVYVFLVILSAGLMVYSSTLNVPFQFDDYPNIVNNPLLRSLHNFFLTSRGYLYNPRRFVGYLTLALNYHFGGFDVAGYHLVNLAIHVVNGFLVYLLVILTFKTPYFSDKLLAVSNKLTASGNTPPSPPLKLRGGEGGVRYTSRPFRDPRTLIALFAALLFVVHPIQTEAVTYIVQRFTSLTAMFCLLSVVMYAKGRLSSGQAGKLASFFFSLLSAVLAMKTKEIAFTLPVLIVLYEFFFFKSSLKKKLLFLSPLLLTILIIPISVIGTHKPLGELLSDLSARTRVQTNIPRWDYLVTQFRVVTTYIRLLFLPVNQNLDYDYPVYHSFFSPPVFLSFLFLLAILGIGGYLLYRSRGHGSTNKDQAQPHSAEGDTPPSSPLKLRGDRGGLRFDDSRFTLHASRLISFGILWFFITLSVTSSVIPIADVIFEHRVYLPSVGAFIAISASFFVIAASIGRKGTTTAIASVAIILLLSAGTYARNHIWGNEVRLWQDVVRKSPRKLRPHYDLGLAYENDGQTAAALDEYRIALRIDSRDPETHNNIGGIYFQEGRMKEALTEYLTALRYAPGSETAHFNAGNAYFALDRLQDAAREYQSALRLDPEDAAAHNNLGGVYLQQGRLEDALREIRKALKADPEYAEARVNLAKVLDRMRE